MSVLRSLPVDSRLIVVNDGGVEPSLDHDPRLDVLNLTVNRGRYFADAVVLATLEDDEETYELAREQWEVDRYQHRQDWG